MAEDFVLVLTFLTTPIFFITIIITPFIVDSFFETNDDDGKFKSFLTGLIKFVIKFVTILPPVFLTLFNSRIWKYLFYDVIGEDKFNAWAGYNTEDGYNVSTRIGDDGGGTYSPEPTPAETVPSPDPSPVPTPSETVPAPDPVPVEPFDWGPVIIGFSVLFGIAVLLLISWGIYKFISFTQENRKRKRAWANRWELTHEKFFAIEADYSQIESDATNYLTMPLIFDMDNSKVKDFHDLWGQTTIMKKRALDIDNPTEYEDKVHELENHWVNLKKQAEDVGIPGIGPRDRERARNMLAMIMDESITGPERELWREKLSEFLDDKMTNDDSTTGTIKTTIIDKIRMFSDLISLGRDKTPELEH